MGFSEKPQVEESDGTRKWVIAGISLRAPLKPIYTTSTTVEKKEEEEEEEEEDEEGEEARIPTALKCPPAPRKRKPSLKCNYRSGAREFFTPPDLETVFIRHVERAN
ncbi:hypothetical protein V8G54_017219 [Vigna mungo]|uniref:Cyclin-dependent protein kinase inhibitor SMR6 n=1 Tax=Vigna mungo TaxID=3915 RepID=A0AAQ3NLQ8_VIGMU